MNTAKIGIVTFVSGTNFGCYLQRYALQTFLKQNCYVVKFVNHIPSVRNQDKSEYNGFLSKLSFLFILNKLINYFKLLVNKIIDRKKIKDNSFKEFTRGYLINTDKISKYSDVRLLLNQFDVFIAGSDQIWNPNFMRVEAYSKYYMLDFVPKGKKISYAASLGISQIRDKFATSFSRCLSDFTWLSVRENEGARELERVLDRPVDVVLDPTMLLTTDEWDKIADAAKQHKFLSKPYILCYSLGNKKSTIRKAKQIQKREKLPIVYLCESAYDRLTTKTRFPSVTPVLDAGPCEFVAMFKKASYIVTDSFHGSVFSILYHKPFFTMMRDNKDATKSMNSRMTTLFSTFHLESRLFSPEDKTPLTPESFQIDYDAVDKILQERREFSINKLNAAIQKVLDENANA